MNKCIVFKCDGKYAIGVGITLLALKHFSPQLQYDVIIYYESWNEEDVNAIKKIDKNVKFIEIDKDEIRRDLEKLKVDFNQDYGRKFIKRYGIFPLLWYKIFHLLDNYEQVLVLDADLLILDDITPIFEYKGLCQRTGVAWDKYQENIIKRGNGGVVLIDKKLPYKQLSNSFINHLATDLINDELGLARSIVDLGHEITDLPNDYNTVIYSLDKIHYEDDMVIYHTVGKRKIWNSKILQITFPEYINFLKQYLSIRNPNFIDDGEVKLVKRTDRLKNVYACLIWKSFFEKINNDLDKLIINFSDFDKLEIKINIKNSTSFFILKIISPVKIRVYYKFKRNRKMNERKLPAGVKFFQYPNDYKCFFKDISYSGGKEFVNFKKFCSKYNDEKKKLLLKWKEAVGKVIKGV